MATTDTKIKECLELGDSVFLFIVNIRPPLNKTIHIKLDRTNKKWLAFGFGWEVRTRRHIKKPSKQENFRQFVLCTRSEQLAAEIDTLADWCDFLTISGLDNILADLTREQLDQTKLKTEVDALFQKLEEYRVDGLKIVIEPLIPWKKHPEEVRRAGLDIFKTMKNKFPGILFAPRPPSLRFAPDGVHLVERSSHTMYKVVKELCEDFFFRPGDDEQLLDHEQKPEDQDLDKEKNKGKSKKRKQDRNEQSDMDTQDDSDQDDKKHAFKVAEFYALVKEFRSLKRQVFMNRDVDLLVHAGTKEDIDKLENNQNMNKVVISGLDIANLWTEGKDWKDRVAMIKKNVLELFKFIDSTNTYEIGYVKHLNQKLKASRQIVEITLESEHGRGIRKALSQKIKTYKHQIPRINERSEHRTFSDHFN